MRWAEWGGGSDSDVCPGVWHLIVLFDLCVDLTEADRNGDGS